MDNISRENTSYLPVAGLIAGVLALVLSIVALAKVSSASKAIAAQGDTLGQRIDAVETSARTATATATQANGGVSKLTADTNTALGQVASAIGDIRADMLKLQEAAKPKAAAGAKSSGPVVAGPGEYVIKTGDNSGTKIAKENGVSLTDLMAVNPDVDWKKLKIGQKLKLPQKK